MVERERLSRDERVLRALHELRVQAEEFLARDREGACATARAVDSRRDVMATDVACRKNSA